jgi:hypothetical protein
VITFNTRTGAVTPASGDYSFSLLSGTAVKSQLPGTTAFTDTANSFSASQRITGNLTISGGNLDLDSSTATTGNIMKNGMRFLHNFGSDLNTFLGVEAGNLTMTGDQNTAIGTNALFSNSTGANNTASGVGALYANTTGVGNTASGEVSLTGNTMGTFNTASGYGAAALNTTGNSNTAIGMSSLYSNGAGNNNVAVGRDSGYYVTTGSYNVAVGWAAGSNVKTGSNNIYFGANVSGVADESDSMYLGGTQTKTVIAGVRGTTTVNPDAVPVMIDSAGQLGTVSSSGRLKEDIHDMADTSRRLLQLRPVTFRYKQAYGGGAKPIQYGLIAEEVAEVFPELAVRNAKGEAETVHYETLNVLLLNELQKQQQRIEEQEGRIDVLEQRLKQLLRQSERSTSGR